MAAAAADFFDGHPVAAIFASPLERAQNRRPGGRAAGA